MEHWHVVSYNAETSHSSADAENLLYIVRHMADKSTRNLFSKSVRWFVFVNIDTIDAVCRYSCFVRVFLISTGTRISLPVRYTEHHVCAADSQNSCCGVESNPGNFGSGPLVRTHSRYALYDSLMPPLSAIFSPWVLIPFNWKSFVLFFFSFMSRK